MSWAHNHGAADVEYLCACIMPNSGCSDKKLVKIIMMGVSIGVCWLLGDFVQVSGAGGTAACEGFEEVRG